MCANDSNDEPDMDVQSYADRPLMFTDRESERESEGVATLNPDSGVVEPTDLSGLDTILKQLESILCPCANPKDYVGSTQDPKVRWSHHKSDCRVGNWANCGLTEHMGQHHQDDMGGAIANLKVTLLDHLTGNYREERLLQLEKDWIIKLGTFGPTGLNTRNQLLSQQRRNWGPGH